MAYTTIQTLNGSDSYSGTEGKPYSVDLDFSKYNYRFFIKTDGTYTGQNDIHASRSGVYNGYVVRNYVQGSYYSLTPLPANGVYEITIWGNHDVIELQRELKNTAPTTPGAFTQPTGELEIGDLKVISWGVASDAESNLSGYTLEVSINGGAFIQIATPTQPTFNYTIPTATTLKFRVKALDAAGVESGYRESAVYTVTKPKYYWSKYNVITNTTYNDNAPYSKRNLVSVYYTDLYRSYNFDNVMNQYYVNLATPKWKVGDSVSPGAVAYGVFGGGELRRYEIDTWTGQLTGSSVNAWYYTKQAASNTFSTSYTMGSLVQSGIIAVDGTYPTNGRHSDGFWYVRGSRVNQSIAPTGAFTSPQSGKVFKPSEVATVTFTASAAPNISLYEVDYKYGDGSWQTLANNA